MPTAVVAIVGEASDVADELLEVDSIADPIPSYAAAWSARCCWPPSMAIERFALAIDGPA